jgi:NAD(P)-dependent dehydrogenase (short-subunit alcohol dehydrogenase family)
MAIALITGTSSGIGLATAVSLARGGHTVIATMRNLASAGELSGLVAAEQLPVTMLALDVDDDASVAHAHGRIDVLVNNAGIAGPGAVDETPLDFFRRVMETNYFGALRAASRQCCPACSRGARAASSISARWRAASPSRRRRHMRRRNMHLRH